MEKEYLKKITKNLETNKILAISLIAIFAISMLAPLTLAQVGVPQPEKTSGYIDVAPRLIGVGQSATVNLFIYPIPTDYAYLAYYDGYRGVTVTFVKPDGSKDTFMPVDGTGAYAAGQTQSLGAIYFFYEPDMAGNWSVSFTMPNQNLTDATGTVLMTGCTSNTAYFTVQTDPVLAGLLNGYPWSPLPNEYWSYPINSNNREWSAISGDWLGSASTGATILGTTCRLWQPYGTGPNSAHINWKQPIRAGGIIGGDYGSLSYGTMGSQISSVVIGGKLFVNLENTGKFECVDLATGEVLYTADGSFSYGLHVPGTAYQQAGASPSGNVVLQSSYGNAYTSYLFGTSGSTWNYYDFFTGRLTRSIVNASGISSYYLVDGTPLAYAITGVAPNQNLVGWNMTKLSSIPAGSLSPVTSNNWPTGIEWSVPLPASIISQLPQVPGQYASSALRTTIYGVSSDVSTLLVRFAPNEYKGYSTTDGHSLWNLTLDYPAQSNQEICLYPKDAFIIFDPTDIAFKCYSLLTGNLLWTSTSFSDSPWATSWTVYLGETNDNDNFYATFPDGTARAYSLTDGHEVWRSEAIPSTEYPANAVPTTDNVVLVDGKLYIHAGYSGGYKINPILRQGMILCINATTGDTIFTLNGGLRVSSAADGYVICTGDFDGNLYGLGKGKTETTVAIQNNVIAQGGAILIQGNVLDQSPAQPGTPAVSDDSMSEWMDYLNMQNATLLNNPPAPKGVTVRLAAVDPNGNVIDIGTVTSDSDGMFKKTWTPSSEGEYTVYATFDGSNSYYGSYAETAISVVAAPASPAVPTPIANPPYELYTIGSAIAVIVAIAIVAVLLLRKRP